MPTDNATLMHAHAVRAINALNEWEVEWWKPKGLTLERIRQDLIPVLEVIKVNPYRRKALLRSLQVEIQECVAAFLRLDASADVIDELNGLSESIDRRTITAFTA